MFSMGSEVFVFTVQAVCLIFFYNRLRLPLTIVSVPKKKGAGDLAAGSEARRPPRLALHANGPHARHFRNVFEPARAHVPAARRQHLGRAPPAAHGAPTAI